MRSVIARIVLLGLVLLVVAVWLHFRHLRVVHDGNLRKAEQFHRDFVQHFYVGAELSDVMDYWRIKPVQMIRRSVVDGKVGELVVVTAEETSPHWFCGKEMVGIIVDFTKSERLQKSYPTSWSWDCL